MGTKGGRKKKKARNERLRRKTERVIWVRGGAERPFFRNAAKRRKEQLKKKTKKGQEGGKPLGKSRTLNANGKV